MSGSNGIYAFKSKAWIYWLFGGLWLLGFWLSGESATAATLNLEVTDEAPLTRGWGPDVHLLGEDGKMERAGRCATRPVSADEAKELAMLIGYGNDETVLSAEAAAEKKCKKGKKGKKNCTTTPPPPTTDPNPGTVVPPIDPGPSGPAPSSADHNVRVAFHLISSGDQGQVSDERVWQQIDILNRSYNPIGIGFVLDLVNRVDNPSWFTGCMDGAETEMKKALAADPTHVLNIYVCGASKYLGVAYMPMDWPANSTMHGAIVRHTTLPGGSAAPYNEGDTVVHEVGHYLGLHHTFEYGCGLNDYVLDTPAESVPAYGCPAQRDTCPGGGPDPIDNFMNYTDDGCMARFTPGQGEWIADMLDSFRPNL